jgi:predicted ATPase/DNA-binding CsgD family transcriptional regulator
VLDEAAALCEAIVRGCPHVTVLTTSRVPLGIPGESDWRVPTLSADDAVRLFVERATKADAKFKTSGAGGALVERICADLDGLPLAIELAAPRVRMLSLEQIADGLRDRFDLLKTGQRGVLPRHQTLRASMDWSYDLLTDAERRLLRRLSVFAGGWSLEAVEEVCAGEGLDRSDILDLLASLTDESLVVVEQHPGAARYRLLETVRQYAHGLLAEGAELLPQRDRHLAFFVALSERAGRQINTPASRMWIDVLEPEAANLQAAVDHAISTDPQQALRIGVALTPLWRVAGQFARGRQALAGALDASDPAPSALRARALWSCGFLARFAGDAGLAFKCAQEALEMAEAVGDEWTLAMALVTLGSVQMFRDPLGSRPRFDRALTIARSAGDPWLLMMCLSTLGRSFMLTDDLHEVERIFNDLATIADEVGPEAMTHVAYGFAWCAMWRGDLERCAVLTEQAMSAARQLGDSITEALADRMMASIDIWRGRPEAGLDRLRSAEATALARGAFMTVPPLRIEMARAYASLDRHGEALALLGEVVEAGAGSGYHQCYALVALGEVLLSEGDLEGSQARAEEVRALAEQMRIPSLAAAADELLGRLAADRGGWSEAEARLHDALARRVEIGTPLWLPQLLDELALVAAGLESYAEAARLVGAAERGRADQGIAGAKGNDAPWLDAVAAARREGAAMSLDEAVAWVRRSRGTRKRPTTGWESLTPTERQVVDLVAEGLTNPQVAERMFISRGTVKVHLEHVFQKLEVRSRAELAAEVARRAG